jgi:hypothetical protein
VRGAVVLCSKTRWCSFRQNNPRPRLCFQSNDGTWYKMPDGEYNFVGSVSRDTVRDKAKRAASAVVKSYSVFVTESAGRAWVGLSVVK